MSGSETTAPPPLLEGVEAPFSPGIRTRRRARAAPSLEQSDVSESDMATATSAPPAPAPALPAGPALAPSAPPTSLCGAQVPPPSAPTTTVSGRRVSRKRKMDYAEIIEPHDHRSETFASASAPSKGDRVKGDGHAKVAKVERTSRGEKPDKSEVARHERTDKPERSATKAERKRMSGSEREVADAAGEGATEQPASPSHSYSSEECSPGDRPLSYRLQKEREGRGEHPSALDSATSQDESSQDAAPAHGERSSTPAASAATSFFSSSSAAAAAVARCDQPIKDCYIVIKPLDVSQYFSKARLVDNDDADSGSNASTTTTSTSLPPPLPPSDPTQEIESQLALLEEMSNHLTTSQDTTTEASAGGDAPSTSPAVSSLQDEANASEAPPGSDHEPQPQPPPAGKRARLDPAAVAAAVSPEDCDKDSVSSSDVAPEGGDSPNKALAKRKPRKRKRKNEASEHIVFEAHRGPILDVKTVGRHVLAACEDGSVYCYSLKSGKLKRQYSGHTAAVICLAILEREGPDGEDPVPEFLYTGSLDHQLRCFQFKTGTLVNHPVNLGKPIQCMDENWGTIFMGTKMGEIAKFYTKSFKLNEDYLKCSKDSILALKATKEGARKIVIVAARNEPVTIRDANSGLLMRVIGHNLPHTVYSLLLESSLLYCGTKTGKIPVFSFTTGEEVCKYNAGYGVVCMRVYNHLLFAGCYDGNIYIYSTQDKSFIRCIPGPGKMLLCLDVVKNRIIAGSKDNKLEAWPLPADVKSCIRESRHR